jgi:hypothetical protein
MSNRILYCRWCANSIEATIGVVPGVCQHCDRVGRWSTEKPVRLADQYPDFDEAFVKALTAHGQKYFKQRVHG